ncbi:hypothetical protein MF672_050685 (plasmid) [Actinomadura sp. ATCC 31491]|uniref:SH3 domain-containing protein n=1 Tax=Actinomadura luzonensis TaxID=2805427 RepID=A0ABT0GBM8_9ACTN|nr:hypothetical protein [Actinomadura luzonensis]MCK2215250.1 hypothetical protein [Actinomadura luzonensis]MCK2222022.1 hypothetical protein [Actinomadura luzonensis]
MASVKGRRTLVVLICGTLLISAAPAISPAYAHTTTAPCQKVQITGRKVAIRQFPNGAPIRVVRRGTLLQGVCNVVGNENMRYASKCGRAGREWHQVISGRLSNGSKYGYVPTTCAHVV